MNTLDIGNTDIFDEKYESNLGDKIALDMGIAGSLLNGSSSGSYSSQENNLELITAQLFQWVEQIITEINKCISFNIIQDIILSWLLNYFCGRKRYEGAQLRVERTYFDGI